LQYLRIVVINATHNTGIDISNISLFLNLPSPSFLDSKKSNCLKRINVNITRKISSGIETRIIFAIAVKTSAQLMTFKNIFIPQGYFFIKAFQEVSQPPKYFFKKVINNLFIGQLY
jgi:hypothetical protein